MVFTIYNVYCFMCLLFLFFKQKTAYEMRISDWSSDVCSSDLDGAAPRPVGEGRPGLGHRAAQPDGGGEGECHQRQPNAESDRRAGAGHRAAGPGRSEERRVG